MKYGSIRVYFGKPMYYSPEKSYQQFAFEVMQAVYALPG